MRTRVLPILSALPLTLVCAIPLTQAQDLYVTNLSQLVAEAYSPEHCFYFPFLPLPWLTTRQFW